MSTLSEARGRIRDALGAVVADKASDVFALFHGAGPIRIYRSPRRRTPAVRECVRESQEQPVATDTRRRAWLAVADFLRESGDRSPELSSGTVLRRYAIQRA